MAAPSGFAIMLEPMAHQWLTWRKIHSGIDGKTREIRAAEFTTSDAGDGPVPPELLDQIPPDQETGRGEPANADGALSRGFARSGLKQATGLFPGRPSPRECHEAIAARGAAAFEHSLEPAAFVPSLPPHKNAMTWKPDTAGAAARNDALRASRRFGGTIWRRW